MSHYVKGDSNIILYYILQDLADAKCKRGNSDCKTLLKFHELIQYKVIDGMRKDASVVKRQ